MHPRHFLPALAAIVVKSRRRQTMAPRDKLLQVFRNRLKHSPHSYKRIFEPQYSHVISVCPRRMLRVMVAPHTVHLVGAAAIVSMAF